MDGGTSRALHVVADKLGVIWKRSKRRLPESTKLLYIQLLFDIRNHIMPSEERSPQENLDLARPDIRIITSFLERLATRGDRPESSCPAVGNEGASASSDRWFDIEDEEYETLVGEDTNGGSSYTAVCHVGTQTVCTKEGDDTKRMAGQATQTNEGMTNTIALVGPIQVLEAVTQASYGALLERITCLPSTHADEYDYFMDSYTPVEVNTEFDVEEEAAMYIELERFQVVLDETVDEMCATCSGINRRLGVVHCPFE